MTTNWMRALTVLYPDLSDRVQLELTALEVAALAHVRGVKTAVIMKYAKISNDKITVSGTQWTFEYDMRKLKKDIKDIEKAGGNRYGVLTLDEAKKMLAKLVLAAK